MDIGSIFVVRKQPKKYGINVIGMFGLVQKANGDRVFFQELPKDRIHGGQGWIDIENIEEIDNKEILLRKEKYLNYEKEGIFAEIEKVTGITKDNFLKALEIYSRAS